MQKTIINRSEGHFAIQENPDGSVLIEKNMQFRLLMTEQGIRKIENALTGRVLSMENE